jgi:Tfp pilus assembly protein PilV
MLKRSLRNETGFTMVEMMASILVFAMMTLGITPLLISSMRGSGLSRSHTIGRNVASESMERVRGLPYFESVKNQTSPRRKDVLDLYFPDLLTGASGSGYSAAQRTFTTRCSSDSKVPTASGAQACPSALPPGYSLELVAMFAQPGAINAQGEQTYVAATPKAGYNWNAVLTEIPPTNLLQLTIKSSWNFQGKPRTFQLQSFLGDRQLAPDRMRADAVVDHVVQVSTAYRDPVGRTSYLVGVVGHSNSSISSRATTTANQTVRGARFTLGREEFAGSDGTTLWDQRFAEVVLHAPANNLPIGADITSSTTSITHPDLANAQIAHVDPVRMEGANTGVQVINDLPKAVGRFSYIGSNALPSFSVDNQKSVGDDTDLRLDPGQHVLSMERGTAGNRIRGWTSAEATAITPPALRKVESIAHAEFSGMFLFPTQSGLVTPAFINDTERRAVVVIRDFVADVTCRATAGGAPAVESGSWSATVKYWKDGTNNGEKDGTYVSLFITGSVGASTDPLAGLMAENPLVYDSPLDLDDVYLFRTATKKGYLESMTSNPAVRVGGVDPSGRSREAGIKDAIQIITYRTDPNNPASSLNVSVGNLSCRAVDKRGL